MSDAVAALLLGCIFGAIAMALLPSLFKQSLGRRLRVTTRGAGDPEAIMEALEKAMGQIEADLERRFGEPFLASVSVSSASTVFAIRPCPVCRVRNRLRGDRDAQRARCGKCQSPLLAPPPEAN